MEENVCCFCCGKSSKDDKQSKTKGSTCCFFRKKSPKDEPPRKREDGLANNLYLRKRTKRKLCCFSCIRLSSKEASRIKGEGCLSCFCCGKSSVEERDQGGGGKGTKRSRFISTKSLASCIPFGKKGERSTSKSPKKTTSCLPCLKSKKTSEKTPCFPCLKSETSCFPCFKLEKTSCFPCFKSSDKVVSRKGGERLASISPKKSACCFPCFKVSNNTESRTRGDRSRNTSPRARFSKCGFVNMIFCSSCFKKANGHRRSKPGKKKRKHKAPPPSPRINISATEGILHFGSVNLAARVFTYSELAAATHNFNPKFRLGKGGFGRVYKGTLKDTEQVVAVKQLEKNENQGNRDFLYEVLMLSLLDHPNLISLRGYCVEGDERLLVYDYMVLGSLQDHLLDLSPNSKPMDWNTRMKIAAGAAKGLQFLHDVAFPPVIYGELKASNILIDEDFNAKLSDFGIAKASPAGSKRVTGTGGYSAPEYALTGKLTKMSDVYSFGIMLLEIISGRKAMDSTRPSNEQRLVDWALHLFMDEKRLVQLADPLLEGNFSVKELFQAIAVAVQCLQEEDTTRPQITDVVSALESLTVADSENLMEEQAALGPDASVISVDSHIEITSEHTEDEEPEQEEGEEQGEQEKEEEEEEEKVGEDEDEDPSWLSHSYWEICSIASEDE